MVKRWIAGVSAAALLVSAVGVDAFTNVFMRTVSADSASSQKNAKSTGFGDLEKDTDKAGNYNTGYGLHTNKTASVAQGSTDGRTFDVDLESWYVGENPVDVATLLDASGSMAWTVDTLDPLEVSEQLDTADKAYLMTKYGKDDLAQIQEAKGGYLPQDVVDLILDPEKTDNTKLSYAGYMYYVYEARSFISEFVPLGYWDGGVDPKTDPSLIGYYPFSGDLKNKAPEKVNDTSATGMLINHPTGSESSYNTDEPAVETLKGEFSTQTVTENGKTKTVVKGLNVADSMSKGAILVASPTTNNFSISFKLSIDQNVDGFNEATILYLTDGEYSYRIFRGGEGSSNRLKISTSNSKTPMNANMATNSEPRDWKFTFDFDNKVLKIQTSTEKVQWKDKNDPSTGQKNYEVSLAECPILDIENLKIYIGGNTKEPTKTVDNIYIQDLTINNIDDVDDTETPVANYPLDTDDNGLTNKLGDRAIFVAQPYNNGGTFGVEEIGTRPLEPVIKDNKYLNVKATSQNGAVMIDAVPELDDGFTISMKLSRNQASLNNSKQNIFYLGNSDTKSSYYQYFRSAVAGGYLGIANSTQDDLGKKIPDRKDMVYYKGGMASGKDDSDVWYTNTLVFKENADDNSMMVYNKT